MTREQLERLARIQALYNRLDKMKVGSKEYDQLMKMIREEAKAFNEAK